MRCAWTCANVHAKFNHNEHELPATWPSRAAKRQGWSSLVLRASEQPHGALAFGPVLLSDSYLVDSASSHMLVSKIKPCMSKYKQLCTVKLRMAH